MQELGYDINLQMLLDHAERAAKAIFSKLDSTISPQVFFIAISPNYFIGRAARPSKELQSHIQIIGNEKLEIIKSALSSFRSELSKIEKRIIESGQYKMLTPIDWREHPDLKGVAVAEALEGTLNPTTANTENFYFCGKAIWREEFRYFICPILKLNRNHYNKQFSLTRSTNFSPYSTSLLNLTIRNFLNAVILELKNGVTDGALFDHFQRALPNVLTSSAKTLISIFRVSKTNSNFGLFDDLNSISALPYENRESKGFLIIAQEDHPNLHVTIKFSNPLWLSEHRLVRKAIEMTGENLHLLCDTSKVYGVGNLKGTYKVTDEDLFKVEFTGQNAWRFSHDKNEMMVVELGKPRLPYKRLSLNDFVANYRKQFKSRGKPKDIYQLIETATKQTHGALIVISNQAESEAKRFSGQSISVDPFQLTNENILQLTSIDGALLIDTQGKCFALGAILDGEAKGEGDSSRGSRYNSSLRYISTRRAKGEQCLAIVISTDGMVKLL